MSIGKRIRYLRRSLDLTQKEFAERMGVKQNTIATYETERSVPIDAVISLICREFNVREEWLRTGEGEMFAPTPRDELDALLDAYSLPRFLRGLFLRYAKLPEAAQREVERMILEWAEELSAQGPLSERPADGRSKAASAEETREDYERRVFQGMTRAEYHEELDRQLDEQEKEMDSACFPYSSGSESGGAAAG